MKCPWDHDLEKREPGFTKKVKALRDEDAKDLAADVQFCSACDSSIIEFAKNAFYTCSEICDVFICLACAECSNGHQFKIANYKANFVKDTLILCTMCTSGIDNGKSEGYIRCEQCEESFCHDCKKRAAKVD